jgi:hypothetical protein
LTIKHVFLLELRARTPGRTPPGRRQNQNLQFQGVACRRHNRCRFAQWEFGISRWQLKTGYIRSAAAARQRLSPLSGCGGREWRAGHLADASPSSVTDKKSEDERACGFS